MCFIAGQSWFRLGQEYERGQLGNAEALGLGLFPVEEAKQKITANDNTFALAA